MDAGAHVIITSRDLERAGRAAADLGPRAFGLELDASDERAVAGGVAAAWERLRGIDLLVNKRGCRDAHRQPPLPVGSQPFRKVAPDGFRDVLETRATDCLLMARAVVPRMLEQGNGRIVTISMNEATIVRHGVVPYGPFGASVEALSRVMAADLADSAVTVNLLLPGGATDTGTIPDDTPVEARERLLNPAIRGPPIVWLASPAAAAVHDQRIVAAEFEQWLAAIKHPARAPCTWRVPTGRDTYQRRYLLRLQTDTPDTLPAELQDWPCAQT